MKFVCRLAEYVHVIASSLCPAKGGKKKTVYNGQPSIKGLFKSCKLKTVQVCVFPSKPAETLPGHEERRLKLRLERQESMQKDWQWRREVLKVGGPVSGWLKLEQQLPIASVPLSGV